METFEDRLLQLLNSQKVVWWVNQLNVSGSLISSKWKKGKATPRTETIIKMCEVTGISANWLLLGIRPKKIENSDSYDKLQNLNRHTLKLEKRNRDFKKCIKSLNVIFNTVKADIEETNRSS